MNSPTTADQAFRFGQALKPLLKTIAEGLRPHSAAASTLAAPDDLAAALARLRISVGRFNGAMEDIPRVILPLQSCTDARIGNLVWRMHQGVDELVVLRDWAWANAQREATGPRDQRFKSVVRDTLIDLADWMADFILASAEPEGFAAFDDVEDEADFLPSIDVRVPGTVSDLDKWMCAEGAFPAEKVSRAFRAREARLPAQVFTISLPTEPMPAPKVKAPSSMCAVGGGLILGVMLSDWLSGD